MKKVELFFVPLSFYSQKVRLALEEKGINYKETFVSLGENVQNQAWFLKLNPNGEVPTLRIGDQCYIESEKIIEVVDELASGSQKKLIPDPTTPEGKLVAEWRAKINELNIGNITYGVALNPEFSIGGLDLFPAGLKLTPEVIQGRFGGGIKEMEAMKIKHPELKDSYERKIAMYKQRLVNFFDKKLIFKLLEDVDMKMVEIEKQLCKNSSEHSDDYWLCGEEFTAADISLCVLLGRFRLLGMLPRFADAQKYPTLVKYWQRAQAKPSVQKVVINNINETRRMVLAQKFRRFTGIALGVGAVGLAVWLVHRRIRK